MTTKKEVVEDRRNVLMREALKQEIHELAKKSVKLKKSLEEATTEYKRERFMTKLRRNNNKIFELVEALEKIPPDVKFPPAPKQKPNESNV